MWLGRDAEQDSALPRDWLDVLSREPRALPGADDATDVPAAPDAPMSAALLDDWTREPRRYGLHATLKAPFRLAVGQSVVALDAALRALAASTPPFTLALQLRALRGFLAWQAAEPAIERGALQALADRCVRELDLFRAPPTAQDRARRLEKAGGEAKVYDAREAAHLERWGYPYVFDTFRFHITLTNRLASGEEAAARRVLAALARWVATKDGASDRRDVISGVAHGMPVRDISLFIQAAPDRPFVVARHYGFDGRVRDAAGAAALGEKAVDAGHRADKEIAE
ncbi:DUF1045 domain-containing protein [Robbsia sp. KACC 23696]|uniref:DUF1045 domain-containing protein n=1 Tax=Robbsia sp. KACC 23696 TaxID=3149231 RepID=UPI00325C187C